MNKLRRHNGVIVTAVIALFFSLTVCNLASAQEAWPEGETFGDWTSRCRFTESPIVTCVMTQIAIVESSSERLMRINISHQINSPDEQQGVAQSTMQLTFPLGISLIEAPQLFVDGSLRREMPINVCLADGCYSTFNLAPPLLEALLKMNNGHVLLTGSNGELTELPISGAGSRAAYNAMVATSKIQINE